MYIYLPMLNFEPAKIYGFITGDFEDSWNALANHPIAKHKGNFMFGLQSMILLEFICRLCYSDKSGKTLIKFSNNLYKANPKYFTPLPGNINQPKEFLLPYCKKNHNPLLWTIFDTIRNGQAYQYQPIIVNLSDGSFAFSLTGANDSLENIIKRQKSFKHHLSFCKDNNKIMINIETALLYWDIKTSFQINNIKKDKHSFNNLKRPYISNKSSLKQDKKLKYYNFTLSDLEKTLKENGHDQILRSPTF